MLVELSIRDIVLVDRLDIAFEAGLCVLTGETGAGKSILLDALGLATGARADAGLIRPAARQASVTAVFHLPGGHPARRILADRDLPLEEDQLVLRRTLAREGPSRAFVNDQPASVALLRSLGESLLEIHGQHNERGLFDPANHRGLLDLYAGLGRPGGPLALCRDAYAAWRSAARAVGEAETRLGEAEAEEGYNRHVLEELEALAPTPREESELAAQRARLMQGERLREDFAHALDRLGGEDGVETRLRGALRRFERRSEDGELLAPLLGALERATIEAGEAMAVLEALSEELAADPRELEAMEERLFALRAAARKHKVTVDALPALAERLAEGVRSLDEDRRALAALRAAEQEARSGLEAAADALTQARRDAAVRFAERVTREFPPLRLDHARFRVRLAPLSADQWSGEGAERVTFEVSTNPGAPFGPLNRIASGGELARFMLALKVVAAGKGSATSLVFDEIDQGVGGAVAHAVGERLAQLAEHAQVLVVTHSPQVAARGTAHWLVSKAPETRRKEAALFTRVDLLDRAGRRDEIARMLSGAVVTGEARAAAVRLMESPGE